MSEKDQIWYAVAIDNDFEHLEYTSPNLDYIQRKIDSHLKSDARRNRYHTYTIVNCGTIDKY